MSAEVKKEIALETLSNLRAEKEQKFFEPYDIANWTSQLCDALDYAHNQARVVHRI